MKKLYGGENKKMLNGGENRKKLSGGENRKSNGAGTKRISSENRNEEEKTNAEDKKKKRKKKNVDRKLSAVGKRNNKEWLKNKKSYDVVISKIGNVRLTRNESVNKKRTKKIVGVVLKSNDSLKNANEERLLKKRKRKKKNATVNNVKTRNADVVIMRKLPNNSNNGMRNVADDKTNNKGSVNMRHASVATQSLATTMLMMMRI